MLPAFLLVGVGHGRRVWIPLPFFLLWPFWLLGWVVWFVLAFLRVPQAKALRMALVLGANLSGLRVDVEPRDGSGRIRLRLL